MSELIYSYEKHAKDGRQPRFVWAVVGPNGGVHIWAQAHDDETAARYGERFYGGVECHWPVSAGEALHQECWLLKGPCRHDGSSLYFSEYIGPMLSLENVEGEIIATYMRNQLADWYADKIGHGEASK